MPLTKTPTWIEIYTDGASSGNPGPAGLGVVLIYGKHRKEISLPLGTQTNNFAELMAVKAALEAIRNPKYPVRIYTDSTYVIGILSKGWKAKANQNLIQTISELIAKFTKIEFVKVEGHAGVLENERADELARKGAEMSICKMG